MFTGVDRLFINLWFNAMLCCQRSDGTLPSLDSHQNERDKKLKRQPSDVSCEVCRSAKCDHQKGDKPLRKKTWRRYLVHIITASLVLVMAAWSVPFNLSHCNCVVFIFTALRVDLFVVCIVLNNYSVISLTTIFLVDRAPPVENNYRVFEWVTNYYLLTQNVTFSVSQYLHNYVRVGEILHNDVSVYCRSDVATTHDPSMSQSSHADVVTVDPLGRNTTATANNSNAGGGGTYSNSSTVAHSVFGIGKNGFLASCL